MRKQRFRWMGWILALLAAASVLRLAARSADYIYGHVVIDDAIYYVQPAMNLVAGDGYTFDGEHRTNGVQPLWAAAVVVLAAALGDRELVVRAMVLVGGLLWIAAGLQLYRLLSRMHWWGGLLALMLWLAAGQATRFSMWGMETGLLAFVLMRTIVLAGRWVRRRFDDPERSRVLWQLGLSAGLLGLCRVDHGLLVVFLGVWILGVENLADGPVNLARRVVPFVLPVAVMGFGWLALSRLYFGEWLPISGTVKAFTVAQSPAPEPVIDRLSGVSLLVLQRSFHELISSGVAWWVRISGQVPTVFGPLVGLLALTCLPLVGAPALLNRLRRMRPLPTVGVAVCLLLFSIVHITVLAVLMFAYSSYCQWYVVAEITGLCLLIGGASSAGVGRWFWLASAPLMLAVVATFAAAVPKWFRAEPTFVTEPYLRAGQFAQRWLPEGATIGAFASGYVSLAAPSHRVLNLDGLINDSDYFRNFLSKGRMRDYFARERIGYVVDNHPASQWRKWYGGDVEELPASLQVIHCWPTAGDWVACVLATDCGPSGSASAPAHPLGSIRFRALVLEEVPVVPAALVGQIPPDGRIVSTVLKPPLGEVAHIVVTGDDAMASSIDESGIEQLRRVDRALDGTVELVAVELPDAPLQPGARFTVVTFWRALSGVVEGDPARLRLAIDSGGDIVQVEDLPAHGTMPAARWRAGQLLSHTFVVQLPNEIRDGLHTVSCGLAGGTECEVGSLRVQAW